MPADLDQDGAIEFYESIDFEKRTDTPLGGGYRRVEVHPRRISSTSGRDELADEIQDRDIGDGAVAVVISVPPERAVECLTSSVVSAEVAVLVWLQQAE